MATERSARSACCSRCEAKGGEGWGDEASCPQRQGGCGRDGSGSEVRMAIYELQATVCALATYAHACTSGMHAHLWRARGCTNAGGALLVVNNQVVNEFGYVRGSVR